MTIRIKAVIIIWVFLAAAPVQQAIPAGTTDTYAVGVGDTLEIQILQPEQHTSTSTVSPDGNISVIYIGNVKVKGRTIYEIKKIIEYRLANGYLKYPVISVSMIESKSRKFTITGEVNKPGTYPLDDTTTALKAISIAGGFTRFGSSSSVKILRPHRDRPGYKKIVINIKKVMNGSNEEDLLLESGDIIIVSEGLF